MPYLAVEFNEVSELSDTKRGADEKWSSDIRGTLFVVGCSGEKELKN